MQDTRIDKRYAKALFDIAIEQNLLEEIYADMNSIRKVCLSNRDFVHMLFSPIIKSNKKLAIINEIFGKEFNVVTLEYFQIIIRKRREEFIAGIAEAFTELYKEHKGIKTAYLKTAVAIDDTLRNRIKEMLHAQTGCEIELVEMLKKDLIGGFVLTMDDKQYDASILKQIKELHKDFDVNLYVKGF